MTTATNSGDNIKNIDRNIKSFSARRAFRNTEQYKGMPYLLAFPNSEGQLRAWCPYCRKVHFHGKGDGHRAAHCNNAESPFNKTGYVLYLPTKEILRESHLDE